MQNIMNRSSNRRWDRLVDNRNKKKLNAKGVVVVVF